MDSTTRDSVDERRTFGIDVFCQRNDVSRTTAYEEIKGGRLQAVKCGMRTLITKESEDSWRKALPAARSSVTA
jgi:predicted site-specific integrase-resolvase